MNTNTMPQTVPMREILRNWKGVFAKAKKSKEPIIILSNSEPQAALISLDLLEKMRLEVVAKEALADYKAGRTISISTPEELDAEFEEIRKIARKK